MVLVLYKDKYGNMPAHKFVYECDPPLQKFEVEYLIDENEGKAFEISKDRLITLLQNSLDLIIEMYNFLDDEDCP